VQLSGRLRLPSSCTAEKNKSKKLPRNSHYDWYRKRGQVIKMYGISVYQDDSSFVIDKSVRYLDSAFVRLYRRVGPSTSFREIAEILHQDELRALGLLGLEELLQG